MQQLFPALTHLNLRPEDDTVTIILDSFLSGFTPRLRTIYLDDISFTGLPKLLFSAAHLFTHSLSFSLSRKLLIRVVVSGTGLQLVLCLGSRSHRGKTLRPEWIPSTAQASRHR